MAVKIQFEIGHMSKLKIKKTREGFTHDWELYVKGVNGADISSFVEKVIFYLHDSFPKPKRVCKEPPYMIQESGYAGFMLPIDIHLRNRDEPKMLQFNYDLALHTVGPPQHRSDIQKYIFENPSEEFRQKLLKGGGVPVAGVMSSGTITTPLPLAFNQDSHKSASIENKKCKSRPDDAKVASFADLFGPPITKAPGAAMSVKQSPDYKPPSNNVNQMSSKTTSHALQSSASATSLNKEFTKNKEKGSSSYRERSKDHQERKEKQSKTPAASPRKDGGRNLNNRNKHERHDKSEDKFKKEKTREKEKDRSRNEKSFGGSFSQCATPTAGLSTSNSTVSMTPTSMASSKRPINSPSGPRREIPISPHRSSPLAVSNVTTNFNNAQTRPSSSNGAHVEADGRIMSGIKQCTKDTAGSIDTKSKETKGRDVNSVSSSRKSKKERKEKDKDKDRERDKEKQKSVDNNQASKMHNQNQSNSNATNMNNNILTNDTKSSKGMGQVISSTAGVVNINVNTNTETVSMKRERPPKTSIPETKSVEKLVSGGVYSTLTSTSTSMQLNSNQLEKGKNYQSANLIGTTTSSTTSATSNISSTATSNSSGNLPSDKDKQRSHKHKKREKNKDRDRDKERERDKDKEKEIKKEDKKEKEKFEKPIDNKTSIPNTPITKTSNSPSLTNLVEENTPISLNAPNSNSVNKKLQNKEKKTRDKSVHREERAKRKRNELDDSEKVKCNKQMKLKNNINMNNQAATLPFSLSTSEHTQSLPTAATNVQNNADFVVLMSNTTTPVSNTTTLTTPMPLNEQLRFKNNIHSNNMNNNTKSKHSSHLSHSDSSNSSCSTDMPLKMSQQTSTATMNNSNTTQTSETMKEINSSTVNNNSNNNNNNNNNRDLSKNIGNTNKASKEKNGIDKNDGKISRAAENKRRRNSIDSNNGMFIEPSSKQIKKDKEQVKGPLRDKFNKSPSIGRQLSTRSGNCNNFEATNAFMQPNVSTSSNGTTVVTTSVTQLPPATVTTATSNNTLNKVPAQSPSTSGVNTIESLGNGMNVATNAVILNTSMPQQQQQILGARAGTTAPPSVQTSSTVANALPTDYWSELQELQHKIMTLQDSEDLQHVVELIAATGCYEITTKTFDFDLCKLDRSTVQRLQDFFAASVA